MAIIEYPGGIESMTKEATSLSEAQDEFDVLVQKAIRKGIASKFEHKPAGNHTPDSEQENPLQPPPITPALGGESQSRELLEKPHACRECGKLMDRVQAAKSYAAHDVVLCVDCRELTKPAPKPESKIIEEPKVKEVEVIQPDKTEHKPDARIPVRMTIPQGNYIKGLVPMMKEIGKIKIGSKGEAKTSQKGTQYRPPVKFDHFEIVSVMRDEHGNLISDPVMKELGENPKELEIYLLYNDETLNFTTRYNEYKGGKCQCSGDGVKAHILNGDEIECNPEACKVFKEKRCKPNGILSVILTKSPRLGGVYKFRTTSYNSIRSILSSLFFIKSLTGGVLAMIPLKLTVSPMTVQPKDSATTQTIYVVNVEFAGTVQQLLEKTVEVSKYQSMMRGQIRELETKARIALTAPETEEEIKEIEAEWYPKNKKEYL